MADEVEKWYKYMVKYVKRVFIGNELPLQPNKPGFAMLLAGGGLENVIFIIPTFKLNKKNIVGKSVDVYYDELKAVVICCMRFENKVRIMVPGEPFPIPDSFVKWCAKDERVALMRGPFW